MNERCAAFRALHHADRPLLLPNAWDHASAAAFVARGHPAVGTTSLGVAASTGLPDGLAATRAENLRLARVLRRLPVLVTVDVEAGCADDPAAVAELAVELAALGVVGINLEDGRADGTLDPPELTAAKVAAVKVVAPELFVNARTDTWWLGVPDPLPEALRRARGYEDAGADGIFVPGAPDVDTVAALVAGIDAPLNVLYRPGGPTLDELRALGVARVSTGSLLFRAALGGALDTLDAVRSGVTPPTRPPSYDEVQRWSDTSRP
ncbi:isocitrate lyase/PEP mutase family protein [Micromonospora peucetia]|uniref:2-Methylisocitrate lyase, PEP mutase family n=1 Tax=Micromonospora peucetia TaxID=47871 RepID=A0A1C6W0J8_9ACTN|nr:isocitrate lyase/phosphoenolpyruvate mutase family protein [Micromonospora peucetia]WSA31686.1 isocitrate lyase/phosphoenolpyruvate mutase family protein [Micromonospora peucetia]SCL71680.1 2-Methylisocitrate lyase, PEP mutase family [Micromonospora peucetia]